MTFVGGASPYSGRMSAADREAYQMHQKERADYIGKRAAERDFVLWQRPASPDKLAKSAYEHLKGLDGALVDKVSADFLIRQAARSGPKGLTYLAIYMLDTEKHKPRLMASKRSVRALALALEAKAQGDQNAQNVIDRIQPGWLTLKRAEAYRQKIAAISQPA